MQKTIKLSELKYLDLTYPIAHRQRLTRFVEACKEHGLLIPLAKMLEDIKVLQVGRVHFACEHLFLLKVLHQQIPDFKVDAVIVSKKTAEIAIERIIVQAKLSCFSSLNQMTIRAFEKSVRDKSVEPMFTRRTWSKILDCNPTTLNSYDEGFKPKLLPSNDICIAGSEEGVLRGIPPFPKATNKSQF